MKPMPPRQATRFDGLANWFTRRRGFSRLGVALVLGVLAVGALPPLYIMPLLVPAFTALLWLLRGVETRRGAFAVGWAFGLGYFAAGLYWISNALLTDPDRFGWMVPIAVPSLATGLAIFIGLATLATHVTRAKGAGFVLVFAIAWTAAEWLRGTVLTGFPWNPIGSVWAWSPHHNAGRFGNRRVRAWFPHRGRGRHAGNAGFNNVARRNSSPTALAPGDGGPCCSGHCLGGGGFPALGERSRLCRRRTYAYCSSKHRSDPQMAK